MTWEQFKTAAPEMAAAGEERFDRSGLVLVGTLRKNGFPRISPVEPLVVDGELSLGMMWRSTKALDLRRDSRCTVHSTVANRESLDGEFKLYGRAREIADEQQRQRYCVALKARIGWSPEGMDYHLFVVDIESAAWTLYQDGEQVVRRWLPESGVEVIKRWKPEV